MAKSQKLHGVISDRIRSGKLPPDVALKYERPELASDQPQPNSVRHGEGHGLGHGADRARNGGAS